MLKTKNIVKEHKGASLIEYGMLVGLIAVLSISAVLSVGESVVDTFDTATQTLEDNNVGLTTEQVEALDEQRRQSCYTLPAGTVVPDSYPLCGGMLIVDNALLASVASSEIGGDETFTISAEGNDYTFSNSEFNIFTGQITTLTETFKGTSFNGNINYWNTANVTDFSEMFRQSTFNSNISSWDTSSGQNFARMFNNGDFNQDIGGWDMSAATDISRMFWNNNSFNQNVGSWNFTSATLTQAERTFNNATDFNQDLSGWCVDGIASEPSDFSSNTFSWTEPKPIWGTCP